MIRSTLLVSAISAILMTSALAQTKPLFPPLIDTRGTPDDQAACKNDAVTLCKSVLGDDMAGSGVLSSVNARSSASPATPCW